MTELLTIEELANLLKVSKRTISELMNPRARNGDIRDNPLPYLKVGRSVRFDRITVEAWLERQSK